MPRTPLNRPVVQTARQVSVESGTSLLSPKELKLVHEYMKDFNGTKAAIRAGYNERTAGEIASRTLRQKHVLEALHFEIAERRQRSQIEVDEVIKYWWAMATADAREFNPVKFRCCRFCWGIDNLYQFTPNEFRELTLKHQNAHRHLKPEERPMLDELGGTGFDQMKDPMRGPEWEDRGYEVNSDHSCPECNGKGKPRIEEVDLSKLSYGAQLIFDGIKVTGDSVEFKLNSNRSKGMEQVQQLLGFVRTRKPIWKADFSELTADELDALLAEAEERGFLNASDYRGKTIDVQPERQDEKVK